MMFLCITSDTNSFGSLKSSSLNGTPQVSNAVNGINVVGDALFSSGFQLVYDAFDRPVLSYLDIIQRHYAGGRILRIGH